MKRLLLILVLTTLLLAMAAPVLAQGNGPVPGADCGKYFGQHVAEHAQTGHLGTEHNPGMHQGFANFLEHGEGEHTCP
ncbi:MAG TPA: hypothetical protein PKD09_22920 [Aggregatilinea sp.]|uniref:hypothetical protein n=1 Tax=Aggregatilinea sp. TaxID=2806333 RepID=UPI002BA768BA|nr:hypothetical protein [Aggregatilinea sp.]HML24523.1 hypothetical protein [Aggregatilinea sp.]